MTVLAGGTSAEELIEGLSIGVGAAIKPGLALLIALAIIIDNLAESLSIGEIIRSEGGGISSGRLGASWVGLALSVWRCSAPPSLDGFSSRVCPNQSSAFFSASAAECYT